MRAGSEKREREREREGKEGETRGERDNEKQRKGVRGLGQEESSHHTQIVSRRIR